MKKIALILCSCIFVSLFSAETVFARMKAFPEKTAYFDVSNRSVNRIICLNGDIKDTVYSEEKGIIISYNKNNLYLKFKVQQEGNNITYITNSAEVFITCGKDTYPIIITPKSIPTVTIELASWNTQKDMQTNIRQFETLEYEKKILKIVEEAYSNEFPESYRISNIYIKLPDVNGLNVFISKIIDIEGEGFKLKEITIKNPTGRKINISEDNFINKNISENIAAVALKNLYVSGNQQIKVYVIEKKASEGNSELWEMFTKK